MPVARENRAYLYQCSNPLAATSSLLHRRNIFTCNEHTFGLCRTYLNYIPMSLGLVALRTSDFPVSLTGFKARYDTEIVDTFQDISFLTGKAFT